MREIKTEKAPKAIGPYAQGMAVGELVFTSGQIPLDPAAGKIVGETVKEQAEQCIHNLEAVLHAAGSELNRVIKTTCFLSDMSDFQEFNCVYAAYFKDTKPARSCVAVKELPNGVKCEIEAIAFTGPFQREHKSVL